MRKLIYSLLIGIVLAGCGEDETVEEQPEINQTEVVDGTPFRVIISEKDGASMVLLPAGSFEIGTISMKARQMNSLSTKWSWTLFIWIDMK